jgi:hypothetical protein
MTRRRVLFCGLLLASVVLACFGGWLVSRPRSMLARFGQVKKGMSRDEVIRIVGGPPGDYSTKQSRLVEFDAFECWSCDDGVLLVAFDANNTARIVQSPGNDGSPTFTERLCRWLGL